MKNIMETSWKHDGNTKVMVGSGKFAMGLGSRVLPGAAHPSRVEVCHGKICSTYTLFNKATNGLLVRIVGLAN